MKPNRTTSVTGAPTRLLCPEFCTMHEVQSKIDELKAKKASDKNRK